jgi:hypothetical protein
MKNLLLIMALAISCFICGNGAAQAPKAVPAEPKTAITIKTAQNKVAAGSNVEVDAEIRNISTGNILFGVDQMETTSFFWDIRDSGNKPVPMTEYGIKANHAEPTQEGAPPRVLLRSTFSAELAPGKAVTQTLALTKEYDLSKPGKYTIQASRFDGNVVVKSNVITLNVTP